MRNRLLVLIPLTILITLLSLVVAVFAAPQCEADPLCHVQEVRQAYGPHVPHAAIPELLRQIADRLNAAQIPGGPFGRLRKTSGESCGGYSCDILCSGQGSAQRQWDVLRDVEGDASPTWSEVDRASMVVRPCEAIAALPPPVPPPPACGACEAEVRALRQTIAELRDELAIRDRRLVELTTELDETRRHRDAYRENLTWADQALSTCQTALGAVSCTFRWERFRCEVRR